MRAMKDSGVEWIGEIPQDWERTKLLNVLRSPISDGPHETPRLVNDGIPFISVDSIGTDENIDLTVCKKFISEVDYLRYKVKANIECGDILFTKAATIGKTAIVKDEIFMVWSPVAIIKANYNIVFNKYIYYVLNCSQLIKHISLLGSYNTQINVGMRELEKALIPLPSKCEQQRIADYLDLKCSKIDSIIEKQQAIIERLKEYKLSVITEAVTKGLNPDVEMKDSGVEWIDKVPKHWKIVKLDDIFDFLGGYAYNSDLYVSESLNQVVRIGNVKNGFLKLDASPVYINDEVAEETSKFKLSSGTILFTMTGTKGKRDYFYTHLITDKDLMEKSLYINQRVGCLISKTDLNAGYFNYLLKDKSILDSIFVYETGTANQGNLGIESIRRTKLQFPSREEQDTIVSYLDKKCLVIDSIIAKKQSIISKLLEYKKSLIYEVVTGKKEV